MQNEKQEIMQTAAPAVQLSATEWWLVLKMLPLHERWEPRLVCKELLEASSTWLPPVFVVVTSSNTSEEEKLPRTTTDSGNHVKATLREALSCYKVFRQKDPFRLFEIRLDSGVHETGMKVFDGYDWFDNELRRNGIISVDDIQGFNLEGEDWKHLLIRSPYAIACYGETGELTCVEIHEGMTTIGSSTFWQCSSLTSVTFPEGVTTIGKGAFFECSSLKSVTLPEGVTTIGEGAFSGCSSLTSVTLPEGVTTIGDSAFPLDCQIVGRK